MTEEQKAAAATLFAALKDRGEYALRSRSRCLVCEAHGAAKMARHLGAITKTQARLLNDMLVVNGLNNPQYCREHWGGALE